MLNVHAANVAYRDHARLNESHRSHEDMLDQSHQRNQQHHNELDLLAAYGLTKENDYQHDQYLDKEANDDDDGFKL